MVCPPKLAGTNFCRTVSTSAVAINTIDSSQFGELGSCVLHTLGNGELILLRLPIWSRGDYAVKSSPLVPVSGAFKSGMLRAGYQVRCPEQMLLDMECWVDSRSRSSWKPGPKLGLGKGVMEAVEGRCPRGSDEETKAQKEVSCPWSHREQKFNPGLPMSSP